METVSDILPGLIAAARHHRNEAMLFTFMFSGLRIRGIFFGRSQTMTIGVIAENVGWQCDLSDGHISEWIPNEAYRVISTALVAQDGAYSNKPFFISLKDALAGLAIEGGVQSPSDDDIVTLFRGCKTSDRKYDKEGDKPFFDHWRRVKASKESLAKIQRHFGRAIREECYKNHVTAVWSVEPKRSSLLFLNPSATLKALRSSVA